MKQSKAVFWIFLFPCLFTFTFTVLVPSISGLYYSFTDWNGIGNDAGFIGLKNYITIFTEGEEFGRSFLSGRGNSGNPPVKQALSRPCTGIGNMIYWP